MSLSVFSRMFSELLNSSFLINESLSSCCEDDRWRTSLGLGVRTRFVEAWANGVHSTGRRNDEGVRRAAFCGVTWSDLL